MNNEVFFSHIQVHQSSSTPKYLQVANYIVDAIKDGKIIANELLPSINELNFNLDISRATAERCYGYLKSKGVLDSHPGKGFYVKEVAQLWYLLIL